jgi:hypothetical protein
VGHKQENTKSRGKAAVQQQQDTQTQQQDNMHSRTAQQQYQLAWTLLEMQQKLYSSRQDMSRHLRQLQSVAAGLHLSILLFSAGQLVSDLWDQAAAAHLMHLCYSQAIRLNVHSCCRTGAQATPGVLLLLGL